MSHAHCQICDFETAGMDEQFVENWAQAHEENKSHPVERDYQ